MELQQSTTDKNASYISKFVVVEGKVHVTKPGDVKTTHHQLAENDNILARVKELRQIRSPEVDGGLINFRGELRVISLFSTSESLDIPSNPGARARSAGVIQQIFPEYKIISIPVNLR